MTVFNVLIIDFLDPVFDQPGINQGQKRACTRLDVVETFGPIVYASGGNTKLLLNGDLSAAEAERLIEEKKIDAVVIGRSFINNPDLVDRLFKGEPLNDILGFPLDMGVFYNFVNSPAEGYVSVDYSLSLYVRLIGNFTDRFSQYSGC